MLISEGDIKMKTNTYTNGILLVIALLLGLVAYRTGFQPNSVSAQTAVKINTQVLCSSCGIRQAPSTAHMIILDQNTGKVWAYRDLDAAPVYLGVMSEPGKIVKP